MILRGCIMHAGCR